MEEVIIEVDELKGPSYGKGIFVFYRNGTPVKFGINSKKEYSGIHHVEMSDIKDLHERFPRQLPLYSDTFYRTLTSWGYDIEVGLCELMMNEQLYFDREYNGEMIRVYFKWIGEKWNPTKNRIRA